MLQGIGSFGWAIQRIKEGAKITRRAWSNSAYIYYVPANKYPASNNTMGTMKGEFKDDMVPYGEYIAILNKDRIVIPFSIGQDSALAEDWEEV